MLGLVWYQWLLLGQVIHLIFLRCADGNCADTCDSFDCPCECYHKEVRCSNKSILSITTYPNFMDIRVLDLDNNRISVIQNKNFKQRSLKHLLGLRLSSNKIKRIRSNTFQRLSKLELLFLNHNYIDDIAESGFSGLGNLKRLYLNDNQLTTLPFNVFDSLKKSLHLLYLHGNKIEHISSKLLENFKHLKTIDLSRNRITKMDGRYFETMPLLQHIIVANNPWSCDSGTICSTIGTFIKVREKRRSSITPKALETYRSHITAPLSVYGDMVCASPIKYMGFLAENLYKNFECDNVNLTEYFSILPVSDEQTLNRAIPEQQENKAKSHSISGSLFIFLHTLVLLLLQ